MTGARRAKRPVRRLRWLALVSAALMLYGGARVTLLVVDSNHKISALYASSMQNRAKLVSVGEQPVGPPPEQIIGGKPGADGADGQDGRDGTDGRDGRDASPAQIAAAVAAYLKAHPPKPGPTGPAGRVGRDGLDGQSPACLLEVDECRGPQGEKGDPGEPAPLKPFNFSFDLNGQTILIGCAVDGDALSCKQLPT